MPFPFGKGKSKIDRITENLKGCFVTVKEKKCDIVDGVTAKYHVNGKTLWSKGESIDGQPDGYWEWYRVDGTLKCSGYFDMGKQVKTWITYHEMGQVHKVAEFPSSEK